GQPARGAGTAVPRKRGGHGRARAGHAAAGSHRGAVPAHRAAAAGRPVARAVRAHRAGLAVHRLCRPAAGRAGVRGAAAAGAGALGVARMSLVQRWALAIAAVLAIVAVGVVLGAWFVHTHERVERSVPLPPSGEAAVNPLYALRQTLRAEGIDTHSRLRLQPEEFADAADDTVLLHGDPSLLTMPEVEALLAWVARGGHLLLRTPPERAGTTASVPPLLRRLGVDALHPAECASLHVQGQPGHTEFCNGSRFTLKPDVAPRLQWSDSEDGHVYGRIARGRGSVDLLADFDFLGNRVLDEAAHQALARQL